MGKTSMTSKNYESDPRTAEVDMSAEAVTTRLKLVSQLRRLCLSLGKAQLNPEESQQPKPQTNSERDSPDS